MHRHQLWVYQALGRDTHDEVSANADITFDVDCAAKLMDKVPADAKTESNSCLVYVSCLL